MALSPDIIVQDRGGAGHRMVAGKKRTWPRPVEITSFDLSLNPFDAAILAAVLVRSRELWDGGELDLCFCEIDKDLQPWDNAGPRRVLSSLYEEARLWVYGDFEVREPVRPPNWPFQTS